MHWEWKYCERTEQMEAVVKTQRYLVIAGGYRATFSIPAGQSDEAVWAKARKVLDREPEEVWPIAGQNITNPSVSVIQAKLEALVKEAAEKGVAMIASGITGLAMRLGGHGITLSTKAKGR